MITPQELREGNWLFCHDLKRKTEPKHYPTAVNWRHIRDLQLQQAEAEYYPIELTPEILNRCGWMQLNDSEMYCHSKFQQYLGLKESNDGFVMIVIPYNAQVGETIKYLHQLQNRYHSLVYEELEVHLQAEVATA